MMISNHDHAAPGRSSRRERREVSGTRTGELGGPAKIGLATLRAGTTLVARIEVVGEPATKLSVSPAV